MSYLSNQKLWKVVKERDNYYYEIRLAGMIIDRIRIEEPALTFLHLREVIKNDNRS